MVVAREVGTVGEIAQKAGKLDVKRILGCDLLSPQVTETILSGKDRSSLALQEFLRRVPADWREHERAVLEAVRGSESTTLCAPCYLGR